MIDPDLLLQGYRFGVFPMAMNDDSIEWFSPDPRAVLPLENFHVPHALRRVARRKSFEITIDNDLAGSKVLEAIICACYGERSIWRRNFCRESCCSYLSAWPGRLDKDGWPVCLVNRRCHSERSEESLA